MAHIPTGYYETVSAIIQAANELFIGRMVSKITYSTDSITKRLISKSSIDTTNYILTVTLGPDVSRILGFNYSRMLTFRDNIPNHPVDLTNRQRFMHMYMDIIDHGIIDEVKTSIVRTVELCSKLRKAVKVVFFAHKRVNINHSLDSNGNVC